MILDISKLTLLVLSLLFLSSCKGQKGGASSIQEVEQTSIGQVVTELDADIWRVYQDRNEAYWFGSNGNGIYHYDGEVLTQFTTKDGLVDNTIRDIQEDSAGVVFIATDVGISTFDGRKFETLTPITDATDNWKLSTDDLWFHAVHSRIQRYDGTQLYNLELPEQDLERAFNKSVSGVPFKDMNNSPYAVYAVQKDRLGNVWFGTVAAGVFRYDGASFMWIAEKELSELPDGRVPGVRSILEDKKGNFWLSNFISTYTIYGADHEVRYEKQPAFETPHPLLKDKLGYFNSGLVDNAGNLWMTTYGGFVWFYDGERLQNFPIKSPDGAAVLLISIYQDRHGVLWLGTHNGGVYRHDGISFRKFEV